MNLMNLRSTLTLFALLCCIVYEPAQAEAPSDALINEDKLSPLSDVDLGVQRARGGDGAINIDELSVQLSHLEENARLDHNVVYSSTTGSNTVSNDAFAGATGFATVIQNSGNNVIIQNATVVNFAVHP